MCTFAIKSHHIALHLRYLASRLMLREFEIPVSNVDSVAGYRVLRFPGVNPGR
jgi:hypothetical protein